MDKETLTNASLFDAKDVARVWPASEKSVIDTVGSRRLAEQP